MQLTSTSTQRTYRYVRIGLIGAALALAIALTQVVVQLGPVSSVSALFYTPERGVFVGVLFAVAFALIALSGHSWEQVILDLAALFAPAMAIVPTRVGPGDVPGFDPGCATRCVPSSELSGIAFGMTTLAIVGVLGIATAVVLGLVQRTLRGGEALALAVAAVIVAGAVWWGLADPTGFVHSAHLVAAVCFFFLLACAAVVSAAAATGGWRATYGLVAVLIAADLVWLVVARETLWGEIVALSAFALFWIVQTVERWDDIDPGILPAAPR